MTKNTKMCLTCNYYKTKKCGACDRVRFATKLEHTKYLKEDASECKDFKADYDRPIDGQ
jgi:hypothetical protein